MIKNAQLLLLSCIGLLSLSCAQMPGKPDTVRETSEDRIDVIDAHIHTYFGGQKHPISGLVYSEETLMSQFKEANIVGAVVMMSITGQGYQPQLKKHNVVFCMGVSKKPNYAEIEKGLQEKKYGCIKVYLGYIHKYASDPVYLPLYKMAEKYSVPVVFHAGDTNNIDGKLKYSDPLTIDEVAVDFRAVKFVIAHVGNPWIQSAAEVAYKNPNVYLDGSALMVGDLSRLSAEQEDELVIKPLRWVFHYLEDPKKLMFATDWPLTPIPQYLRLFKKAIPRQHWQNVFHDNAANVFGLKK